MQSLSPNIFVSDVAATIAYYKQLGFEPVHVMPEDSNKPDWAMLQNGSVSLMFQSFGSLGNDLQQISRSNGGSLLIYITLPNIEAFFEAIKDKVEVLKGLETTFYGAIEFSILDLNNYVVTFAQHND